MIHDCETVLKIVDISIYFSLFKIYNSWYSIKQVLSLRPRSVTSWTKHAPYIKSIRVLCVQGTQSTFVNRVHIIYVSSAKTTMSKISKQKSITLWDIVISSPTFKQRLEVMPIVSLLQVCSPDGHKSRCQNLYRPFLPLSIRDVNKGTANYWSDWRCAKPFHE